MNLNASISKTTLKPVVFFRYGLAEFEELNHCESVFHTVTARTEIPRDSLVICRYSALPFYQELERDLHNLGSTPINSYKQHQWIANFSYYEALKPFTFPSYSWQELNSLDPNTKLVVKGVTNSLKHLWNTHMFAKNVQEAKEVALRIQRDSFIGQQSIIFRKFVPLETFETGINDQPFTNEWRFFFYKDKLLSHGYYWANAAKILNVCPTHLVEFAHKVAAICSQHVPFFVLDVANTANNEAILVEVNDAQMSGLCCNNAQNLYSNLNASLIN